MRQKKVRMSDNDYKDCDLIEEILLLFALPSYGEVKGQVQISFSGAVRNFSVFLNHTSALHKPVFKLWNSLTTYSIPF